MAFSKTFNIKRNGITIENAYHRIIAINLSPKKQVDFKVGVYPSKEARALEDVEPIITLDFCIQESTTSIQTNNELHKLLPSEIAIYEELDIEEVNEEDDGEQFEPTGNIDIKEDRIFYKYGFDNPSTNLYGACYIYLKATAYYSDALEA